MMYEFLVGYDIIANFEAPGYEPKEVSTFLTKAQEEIVFSMLGRKDSYTEEFKKTINKLKTIVEISNTSFSNPSGMYPNGTLVELPAAVMLVYNDRVNMTATANHFYPLHVFTDIAVLPIDDDYYHANKKNPFKKPNDELVWRLDQGTATLKHHIYILPEYCTLVKVILHYYRKPEPIIIASSAYVAGDGAIDGKSWSNYTVNGLDCELDPFIHRKIVDKAIQLAYIATKDQAGFEISTTKEQLEKK